MKKEGGDKIGAVGCIGVESIGLGKVTMEGIWVVRDLGCFGQHAVDWVHRSGEGVGGKSGACRRKETGRGSVSSGERVKIGLNDVREEGLSGLRLCNKAPSPSTEVHQEAPQSKSSIMTAISFFLLRCPYFSLFHLICFPFLFYQTREQVHSCIPNSR